MFPATRRSLCKHLPLLALLGWGAANAQTASSSPEPRAKPSPEPKTKSCTEPLLTQCAAFPFEGLPVRYSSDGAPTRQILEGRIPGSEIIEVHETTLAPGKMPHPAHHHPHAELLFVRQGTIEFLSDNPPIRITAGGAAYCAPNQMHGFHNVGETEAVYFVMKVGAQPVCQK